MITLLEIQFSLLRHVLSDLHRRGIYFSRFLCAWEYLSMKECIWWLLYNGSWRYPARDSYTSELVPLYLVLGPSSKRPFNDFCEEIGGAQLDPGASSCMQMEDENVLKKRDAFWLLISYERLKLRKFLGVFCWTVRDTGTKTTETESEANFGCATYVLFLENWFSTLDISKYILREEQQPGHIQGFKGSAQRAPYAIVNLSWIEGS